MEKEPEFDVIQHRRLSNKLPSRNSLNYKREFKSQTKQAFIQTTQLASSSIIIGSKLITIVF